MRNFLLLFVFLALFLPACLIGAVPDPPVERTPPTDGTSVWNPSGLLSWQIQFSGEIEENISAQVFDLDGFDVEADLVKRLHEKGSRVICYINAGAWEDWRPDQTQFPEHLLGNKYSGWPGEQWLDIRRIDELSPILQSRLDLCQQKGFDGVEFDNLDGFNNNTGFQITAEDQLVFNTWLGEQANKRGLAAGLKNDPEQAAELSPYFDFVISESCFVEGWCELYEPFIKEGKPILAIEYTDEVDSIQEYCGEAKRLGISLILKNRELDEFRETCE